MPIYEYRCQKCGVFEVTQKITDNPLSRCPTCKGKVRKLISNTSFQLKGTGWYVTDYGRKDKPASAEKTSTKSSSDSKSDSKGEAKTSTDPGTKTSKETTTGSSAT